MGLSEATLSNIETDKASLDLAELSRVASALNLPFASLLPRSRISHYLIKRASDLANDPMILRPLAGPEPGPSVHHNPVWPLAEWFVGKHMEPLLVEIRPLPDKELHYIAHDHEEFMFVLRGEVETLLKTNEGLVKEHLRAGDCIYFRSNLPHCHRSATSESADAINVIYSLRGPIDPDDSELGSFGRRFYRRGVYADATGEAGEKIGLLRRSNGLTVAELARDMQLGVRLLAEIERGERAAKIDLLIRLARRFRRPIEYFFSTTLESQPFYSVQRAAQISQISAHHRRYEAESPPTSSRVYRPLALGFADRGLHPYYLQFFNGDPDGRLHQHHGQEFIYVLDGELEFVTGSDGGQTELLHPGDSIFLDSSVPHQLRGHSRNPFAAASAEVLEVFWTPLGIGYLFDDTVEVSSEQPVETRKPKKSESKARLAKNAKRSKPSKKANA